MTFPKVNDREGMDNIHLPESEKLKADCNEIVAGFPVQNGKLNVLLQNKKEALETPEIYDREHGVPLPKYHSENNQSPRPTRNQQPKWLDWLSLFNDALNKLFKLMAYFFGLLFGVMVVLVAFTSGSILIIRICAALKESRTLNDEQVTDQSGFIVSLDRALDLFPPYLVFIYMGFSFLISLLGLLLPLKFIIDRFLDFQQERQRSSTAFDPNGKKSNTNLNHGCNNKNVPEKKAVDSTINMEMDPIIFKEKAELTIDNLKKVQEDLIKKVDQLGHQLSEARLGIAKSKEQYQTKTEVELDNARTNAILSDLGVEIRRDKN